MRYSFKLTLILVLSAVCVTGVPVELESGTTVNVNGNFSIPVTHNASAANHNGPQAFHNAIKKWGIAKNLPSGDYLKGGLVLDNVVSKRLFNLVQDTSVTATPGSRDVQYTIPVNIGIPAQALKINVDTGSADFWVFSSSQPTSQTTSHTTFNPKKSLVYSNLTGYSWSIQYADGSGASGEVGVDTVEVGKATVLRQAVELAKTVSSGFISGGNDGIMGLAFGKLNSVSPRQVRTFFENVMYSLSNKLFTAYLRHSAQGSYDFGYIDSKKYNGTIKYTPLANANGFWEFTSNYYKVGETNYTHPEASTAVADTGTSLLLVSSDAAKNYYATVPGAQANSQVGGYILPCTSRSLPTFSFNVGPNIASIGGQNIIYGTTLGKLNGVSYCFGAIQPISGNQFIFGDIFFKQNFAVFDYGNARFGFAPHDY
ncbi:hypothetical protein H072_10015 [Dactylellina haptotyla CBS 200.50]|uniref:Peptidase A1 domain-containing protein n=1 Tax=Dactylellina haptotyla (strain CBS 200.50) TaxID=1284197 RepID=S8BBC4_DACHA|nr:hypothetical protein H072_10015 [Dactylellina haptotyla CBS 200.50]